MIEIKTYSKPKKTGGSGGSSSSTKYISGVISEAEHAGRADRAKRAEVADQANYAGTAASAQNAAYASEAGNLREDAEILQQYLSLKDTVDPQVVNGMVIFAKGLMSNLLAQLKGGASFGSDGSYSFDKDGNLVIESAHSRDFDEMLQNGFALKRNPTSGKYTLSISDLIVWGRMVINTLETRKKYAIGGNVYLSGASSKIQHVEKVYSSDGETVVGYKCYILKDDGTMATQNGWVVGDQALCQTFDIEEGVYQNVSNQYYWRLVTQVSEENVAITEKYIDKDGNEQIRELYEGQKFAWVVLSKDDCDKNSGVPASGDTIVMDGHRLTENEDIDYTERTNVLMLEATGSGSPRIIALTGIVDYKHDTDNEVFILSPQKVIFTTEHFEIRTASGAPITFVHFMGPWVKGTEYHYYDQVSHANALWTCIVEKGKSTTDEPTDGNAYWRKEMSGGKGEKGDDAVVYTLEASPGYIRLNSDGSIDYTNGYIDKGDEYKSNKYLVVRGYKVVKGVRDNRFSTEESPVTLRLIINDGSAYSEYTPSDGDSVSIDFEPKYEDSYYSMLEEISHSGLNSVRVDMCEGSEYNPNKILATCDIPITQNGKDGQKGDDAVSYSVSLMKELRTIAGHSNQSAVTVSFRKQEGSKSTVSGNIATFGDSASVKCYVDGERSDNMTDWINSGNDYFGYLNYEDAWTGKSVITVVMYIGDNIVASANFSLGQSGEGVVMAYKNAASRPEPPTAKDPSLLSNGWSRTLQKEGSYEKVSNVSYGNYTVGATKSGYSTSEWSEVSDSGETWRKSPAGLSTSSGWALMKVSFTTNVDNADVKVVIKAYSEANFDFIQVHELDKEITGSISLRKTGVVYTSGNSVKKTYNFNVASAGQHFFYVSYCKDSSGDTNGDYGLFRFDLSDNLVSMPSTVWMSQAVLKEGKAVLPWSTPVQVTGDDAYRVEVSPSVLIFDTDDNGRVDESSLSGKTATIRVYQGEKDVSKQFSKYDRLPSNYYNCNGSLKDLNKSPLEIQVTEIETQVVAAEPYESTISKTNGFLEFILTNGSATVTAHVDVQVNVAKFTGQMVNTNKRFSNTLQEVSTSVDDKMDKFDLNEFKSEITQTAREISLSVSEKSIARRNLLVGSAFLREDNHVEINEARIEMNTGYQGTNCIRISDDTTDGKTRYPGAFWDGSQGGKSVRITKGKKYVISCWYFSNDANGHLSLEALYTDKQTSAKRKGAPKYLSAGSLVPRPNQWQLFTTVIDTTDAKYDYIAFNFYEYCSVKSGLIEAYICRPMVEEGDTYNGWTLSQDDYDIIGANLIDNSRTLDTGGNVIEAKGQKTLVGDAYELTYRGSDDYNSFYRIDATSFKLDTDYTISFEVRGDAKYMGVYAFYPITNTKFTLYAEPKDGTMFEIKDDGKTIRYVGLIEVKELGKQQKVWCHFRFKDRLPEQICFQFPKNAEQTGVTSWRVTITKPKIEVGAVVTEYTERKSDLIDKASLKAAGIVVDSESVTLYGNQVHIKKNKTDTNDTVLIDNETGKVSAGLIDADKVVAEGIQAKNLEATNLKVTGNSQLGIFQIKTSSDDDNRDNYTVDGDMITYSGSYKFPDGKTDLVSYDHFTYLTYKPLFIRQGAADRGKYMRLGDCYTEWDDCGYGFDNSYLFNGASARYVCGGVESECKKYVLPTNLTYSTNFFPVSYIYSTKSSKNDPAFAINVQSSGTAGERTAIQTNGAIRGVMAPNAISINGTQQIPSGVGAVICTNGSDITLTLPANPVEGQTLIIIQGSTSKVYIVPPKGDTIYWGGQTRYDTGNRFYSGTIGQFTILVFIRGAWQLQFMNNRP